MKKEEAKARLEELRIEIQEERISYGEIIELQELAGFIEDGDNLLLQWAGVPEGSRELIQMWLDAEEENRKHTKEGNDKCLELKDKFVEEYDKLSDEHKEYVKDYLDDLAA